MKFKSVLLGKAMILNDGVVKLEVGIIEQIGQNDGLIDKHMKAIEGIKNGLMKSLDVGVRFRHGGNPPRR